MNRIKGVWEDTEVTFDILRLPSDDAVEDALPADRKLCIIGVPGGYADVYANEHNYGFMLE